MGLSNRSMSREEALKISREVYNARKKYGRYGSVSLRHDDIEQALMVLLEIVDAAADNDANWEAANARLDDLRADIEQLVAENTKLKQRISGYETAAKRRAGGEK